MFPDLPSFGVLLIIVLLSYNKKAAPARTPPTILTPAVTCAAAPVKVAGLPEVVLAGPLGWVGTAGITVVVPLTTAVVQELGVLVVIVLPPGVVVVVDEAEQAVGVTKEGV